MKFSCIALLLVLHGWVAMAQSSLSGQIRDKNTNEPLIGASVVIKGTTVGTTTDIDGKFKLQHNNSYPLTLLVSYIGYVQTEVPVEGADKPLNIKVGQDNVLLQSVEVVDSRITEKQRESALTVEAMDVLAIKETPAPSFYQGLGNLKGVDMTTASLGFVVINTRGFNSTSPVRSLQLIDGVDNQSPGLNFSLGNFLGASELDVLKVDLIVGASSAFYGPNAFNGVINMTTKSPFTHTGLTASMKAGERALFETAMRYAQAYKGKDGNDKYAWKFNMYYLRANDWEATNMDPATNSTVGADNPGGYDAVNRYGDEDETGGNDYTSLFSRRDAPGLGIFHRTGYEETDLVDYDTRNLKLSAAFHYMLNKDVEFIAASNFGTGTTVYQGENRFSLRDILFFQNRLEIRNKDKWFVRAYATHEDAGRSYDAVFTAFRLQDAAKPNSIWNTDYSRYWSQTIRPRVFQIPGMPPQGVGWDYNIADSVLAANADLIRMWHQETRGSVDQNVTGNQQPYFEPGTARFDSAFNAITSSLPSEGGTMFFDKSALYHVQAERRFTWEEQKLVWIIGANGRQYRPNSAGSIFSDTLQSDSTFRVITNTEFGVYSGVEKKMGDFKASVTMRMDKNENFPFVFSPAASLVYTPSDKHVYRVSLSSAVRNPTLADQFLYYNVGRAILLGNLSGFDSLVTVPSFVNYLDSFFDLNQLQYFDVAPIRPEQVRTIEFGYRTMLKKLYLDMGYYFSWYQNFIGFNLGLDVNVSQFGPSSVQAYRVAANAAGIVTTQGFSVGGNYYYNRNFAFNFNYSWNKLNVTSSDDPIIPAFNTPEHKFNIGVSGRELMTEIGNFSFIDWGFNINYKWIQGFVFEGSPQFTGFIPTYDLVDAQINKNIPAWKMNVKLGASNLLNKKVFQVYGGPRVGRLAYISLNLTL